ncbi:hypothetical protein [Actinokineospora enzanensis]|uniref:hypothetical protein n=1 Tax=Actinokineospora enzanensis TaxID=155975 RepID=UPI000525B3F5|nr:hypothetical protein [Actinokineospora enzanensis]
MLLRNLFSKWWPLATLILLFGISVLIRLPSFNIDPVKAAVYTDFGQWTDTEVWLHDKYVLDIYDVYPVAVHKFLPYVGTDPQFLANAAAPELTVYTSFSPAMFIALYGALRVFDAPATFMSMQVFSLAIHLVSVLLMYYLCRLLTRDRLIGVLGATIYLFATGALWYHMNVYWAHQLLMPVFLTALIVFVRRQGKLKWWEGLGLGLSMSLIAWTGVVSTVGFLFYGGYKYVTTKQRAYLNYLFMLGGMLLALLLIVLQVLMATGASLGDYLSIVAHRAQTRTIAAKTMTFPVMLWRFFTTMLVDYGGYMLIAYTLAMKRRFHGFASGVVFVASFPLLESAILLEHDTIYGFGRLKWLIPVVILICLLGAKFATTRKRRVILVAAVILASILHVWLYSVAYWHPHAR